METPNHRPDGTDDAGRGLTLTIRIGPDGRLYFHDITAGLLPLAAAMAPGNSDLHARAAAAAALVQESDR